MGYEKIGPDALRKINQASLQMVKEKKKRKGWTKELLGFMGEQFNQKRNVLLKKIGIELPED